MSEYSEKIASKCAKITERKERNKQFIYRCMQVSEPGWQFQIYRYLNSLVAIFWHLYIFLDCMQIYWISISLFSLFSLCILRSFCHNFLAAFARYFLLVNNQKSFQLDMKAKDSLKWSVKKVWAIWSVLKRPEDFAFNSDWVAIAKFHIKTLS